MSEIVNRDDSWMVGGVVQRLTDPGPDLRSGSRMVAERVGGGGSSRCLRDRGVDRFLVLAIAQAFVGTLER